MGLRLANTPAAALTNAVIAALNTGTGVLSRIKASAASAITDAALATAAGVAAVPAAVTTALNTGTSSLTRVKASAAEAIADASLATAAAVSGVAAAVLGLLDTGSSTLSRVSASARSAVDDAVIGGSAAGMSIEGGPVYYRFGDEVTVVGATSTELVPANDDGWTDLLGVQISVTGAPTTVAIGNGWDGVVFRHTFPVGVTTWIGSSGPYASDGSGVLWRAIAEYGFYISGSAGGATIKATPRYRTQAV